ncbi:thiamine pyrophosphate-binding protein [Bradyrhizobium sp. JR4.1]|uniref:thiamine pyrophosphate-binding protein n=1 Tax=Bradyrhizobium sp. JR4.1 TaxID=3156372 RepID=UPI003395BBD7
MNGVNICFANPGTSDFVAALDRKTDMRCVLGLSEAVVTGAADGYARMADKAAATLLHCGPGLANGLSNIHNEKRARTPMVNIVGDHATYHLELDAPLTSDIEGLARCRIGSDGSAICAIFENAPRQTIRRPMQRAGHRLSSDAAGGEYRRKTSRQSSVQSRQLSTSLHWQLVCALCVAG